MSYFINTFGGELSTGRSGMGAVNRALQSGLTINQIDAMGRNEGISFGSAARTYIQDLLIKQRTQALKNQLAGVQSTYDQQLQQQASQFNQAQQIQAQELDKVKQQALESQTRQAAPERTAQLMLGGKSMVIRPSSRSRFSRPELQITSMNI